MTLKEYLLDYAPAQVQEMGDALIAKGIPDIANDKAREVCISNLEKIKSGQRYLRF